MEGRNNKQLQGLEKPYIGHPTLTHVKCIRTSTQKHVYTHAHAHLMQIHACTHTRAPSQNHFSSTLQPFAEEVIQCSTKQSLSSEVDRAAPNVHWVSPTRERTWLTKMIQYVSTQQLEVTSA